MKNFSKDIIGKANKGVADNLEPYLTIEDDWFLQWYRLDYNRLGQKPEEAKYALLKIGQRFMSNEFEPFDYRCVPEHAMVFNYRLMGRFLPDNIGVTPDFEPWYPRPGSIIKGNPYNIIVLKFWREDFFLQTDLMFEVSGEIDRLNRKQLLRV